MNDIDAKFLSRALEKAKESVAQGGFPAGAVIVKDGEIIGEGISIGNMLNDATSHGEMAAIRYACRNLYTSTLQECTLYTSMQPCLMCFSGAAWATIPKIVYACAQTKVSPEYYGGTYKTSEIAKEMLHAPLLVHGVAFEEDALQIVREWEELQ